MQIKRVLVNLEPQKIKAIRVSTVVQGSGSGDVVGPNSATSGNFAAFADNTGKVIEDSGYGPDDFSQPGDNVSTFVNDAGYTTAADLSGKADKTIQLIAGVGLDGGGDLSANRTFDLDAASQASLALADSAMQPGDAPTSHASSHVTGGTDKIRDATPSQDGLMTAAQATVVSNTSGTNTGDQNLFSAIAVSGQSNVVADAPNDTLTLVAGSNVTITTDAATDTITIAATGGGGGSGDVTGPASSTDNALTRFDGTTGKVIQNSTVTVSDIGSIVSLDSASQVHRLRGDILFGADGTGMNQQGAFGPSYGFFANAG